MTSGSSNTQSRTKNATHSHRLLLLLLALAFGVSFVNLVLGQRANQLQYTLHFFADDEESEEDFMEDERIRELQLDMPVHDATIHKQKHIIFDGETITKIMKGKKKFPSKHNRLKYKPGTLQMSSAEALQHCYVNVTHYRDHVPDRRQSLVSLSDTHKLIYRNIPKASSSTGRHAMFDFLDGEDDRMKHDAMEEKVHEKGYSMISFVREPMSRFYSSYDEAFFRMGPWMGNGPIVRDKPRVRQGYLNNKYRVDKYPYLYKDFETIDDFRQYYCPKAVLATGRFLDCNEIPSIDDGNLAHRFEQFVRDYDGLDPFDVHLNLQIGSLVFPTGEPFPITFLYNASEADKGWQEIAKERGVDIPDGGIKHGRKITRRFNVNKVSNATKRKICRMLALDYCCLNVKLPDVCSDEIAGEDETVYCAMEKRNEETMQYALEPIVIQAWKDPLPSP